MDNQQNDNKKTQKTGWKAAFTDWFQIIAAAVVIAFVMNRFIISNSDVPTPSMENTIMTGSRIVGSRLNYYFSDPKRGDIAIFVYGWRCPECKKAVEGERQDICPLCGSEVDKKGKTVHYVKRVIGIPGDIIDIVDENVYLNHSDTPLDEPYLAEKMERHEIYHFEVPEDCYFMMGDNRNNSGDARYWRNPYISKDKMIAKVLFEYYPQIKMLH